MTTTRLLALTLAALAAAPLLLSTPARAASSYDACTGFIASLPATISTQGVWCLDKDLNTAVTSGNAITIATNNVTIDCNGYKVGGLLAGVGTATKGVYANGRSNVTVRDCNIRGFLIGVHLDGSSGSGHRVERNRVEANTATGVLVTGDGSLVRDNLVIDTGGTTTVFPYISGIGIAGRVDVIDNQIVNVDGSNASNGIGVGIFVPSAGGSAIHRNRINTIIAGEETTPAGIGIMGSGFLDVRDNAISNDAGGSAVVCSAPNQVLHGNALLMGEPTGFCSDGGDNYGWMGDS